MRHLFFAALAGLLLQGCFPKEVLPDYPLHSTAVTRTYFHNLGFKGLLASKSTRTVSTRADMRREEHDFKFTGFVMKHLTSGQGGVTIWRADKNKQWRLDPKAKTYVECPLLGCPAARTQPQTPAPKPQEEPRRKPSCELTLAKNKFSVSPTGESREINGFKAKRYKISWEVVLQDKDKKKDTSLVTVDLWTTPEDAPRMAAVRAVERKFEQHVREKAAERAGVGKVIPPEAMAVIAAQFLTGLSSDQRAAITSAAQELGKIQGRPVLTHLEWNLGGDACQSEAQAARKKEEKSSDGLDVFHGISGLLGSAAKKEMAGKPVFAFDEELQKMDVEPASDGLFVPPPSYKRSLL